MTAPDVSVVIAAYNAAWAEHFPDPATAPCRTTLGIVALPTPIAIELKCVAQLPSLLPRAGEGAEGG